MPDIGVFVDMAKNAVGPAMKDGSDRNLMKGNDWPMTGLEDDWVFGCGRD